MGYTFHTVLCGHKPSYHHIPASAWFFKLQALMAPLPKSTERATLTSRHRPKSVSCPSVKVPEAHQTSLALPTGSTSAARTKQVVPARPSGFPKCRITASTIERCSTAKKTCYQSFSKRIRRSGLDLSALSGSMIIYNMVFIFWFATASADC